MFGAHGLGTTAAVATAADYTSRWNC